jgi:hypothetical protein
MENDWEMKYHWDEWHNGKVFFEEENWRFKSESLEGEKEIIVTYSDFDWESAMQVKHLKEYYFRQQVLLGLEEIKNQFNKRLEKTHFKNVLVKRFIEILDSVLFGTTKDNDFDELIEFWELNELKDGEYVSLIRKYFKNIYVYGEKKDFIFMCSLESSHTVYQLTPPEVKAEILFLFYKELQTESNGSTLIYDSKYWTLESFELFNYLNEKFVESTVIKKYSLIFHYLKSLNEDKEIINNYRFKMSKLEYTDFITEKINIDFSKNGNPKMNPPETDEKKQEFLPLTRLRIEFEKAR